MALHVSQLSFLQKRYVLVVSALGGVAVVMWMSITSVAAVYSPSRTMANEVMTTVGGAVAAPAAMTKSQASNGATRAVKIAPIARLSDCTTSQPMRHSLMTSLSSQLRKLSQYEQVCGSGIVTKMSFFVATPTTAAEAKEYAQYVASQLREFATHNVSPVVFFEPTTSAGLVDMKAYRASAYDSVLDIYFAAIKARGVTDAMMGTWVPLPEGNLPVWSSVNPDDFAACVTKAVLYQKKHFPTSIASILLDTNTYPTSGNWTDGRAVSLAPYVKGIPAGLIDSVGLQGLPWSPALDEDGSSNGMPRQYLRMDLLAELARAVGTKEVWVNTGSFGVKYANQPGRQIIITPEQRAAQLTGVVSGIKVLQSQGFSLSVHLFAENKSAVPEATDWSYWPNGKAASSSSTIVFKTFVHDLQAANIPLWLFDID
ncbi:MAG: hypothetical protein JWM07_868 [Candidatus Saccharibacteria bacterium]|nr:hypothetical protein [Candidatus Saccharibacteria bacterium]